MINTLRVGFDGRRHAEAIYLHDWKIVRNPLARMYYKICRLIYSYTTRAWVIIKSPVALHNYTILMIYEHDIFVSEEKKADRITIRSTLSIKFHMFFSLSVSVYLFADDMI